MARRKALISLCWAVVIMAVGIMGAEASQVSFFIQGGAPFAAPVLGNLPAFEEATGIDVNVVQVPPDQTLERVVIEAVNRSGVYDVVIVNRPNLPALLEANLLQPIDTLVSDRLKNDLFRSHVDWGSQDGRLYAVPFSHDVRALHYRTDLFEQAGLGAPPQDWDELLSHAQKLTDQNRYGLTFSAFGWSGMWTLADFIVQNGGDLFAGGEVVFDSPEAAEALAYVKKVFDAGVVPPGTPSYWWPNVGEAFAQGNAAMAIQFEDFNGWFNDPERSTVVGKYDLAWIPQGPVRHATSNAGWLLAVPQGARNLEEAGKLIDWIVGPEMQRLTAVEAGTLPALQSVFEALIADGDPSLGAYSSDSAARWEFYRSVIPWTYEMPRTSLYPQIEEALARALSVVLAGDATPEEALKEAAAQVR